VIFVAWESLPTCRR